MNQGADPVAFPVMMRFQARFEDLFEVRGETQRGKGHLRLSRSSDSLRFRYAGRDGVTPRLTPFHGEPFERRSESDILHEHTPENIGGPVRSIG